MSNKVFEMVAATMVERATKRIASDLVTKLLAQEVYYTLVATRLLEMNDERVEDYLYNAMAHDIYYDDVCLAPKLAPRADSGREAEDEVQVVLEVGGVQ